MASEIPESLHSETSQIALKLAPFHTDPYCSFPCPAFER
jgi:hypothetical protein